MTTPYAGTDTDHATVTVPDDNDEPTGALFGTPYEELKDITNYIRNVVVPESSAAARDSVGALNWRYASSTLPGGGFMYGGCFAASARIWIVAGNTDLVASSWDDGITWADFSSGMASAVALLDVIASAAGVAVAVGSSSTVYYRGNLASGGTWANATAPGTPTDLYSVKFDETNSKFIAVGQKAGPNPYIATAGSAGSVWTERTAPAGMAGAAIKSLAVGGGVAVCASAAAATKLGRSTDGGVTWADSTSSLTSGIYQVTYNASLGLFFAIRTNAYATTSIYSSADGDTWTLVSVSALLLDNDLGGTRSHGFASLGSSLAIIGEIGANLTAIAVSDDGGDTWAYQNISATGSTALISDVAGAMLIASVNGDQTLSSLRRAAG